MSDQNLVLSLDKGVRTILINRPEKKNALNQHMYRRLTEILNEDAKNDKIVVTIITGAGEYYSSGNDIKSALQEGTSLDLPKFLVQAFIDYPKILIGILCNARGKSLDLPKYEPKYLVQAFIDYPKILKAVVNGPAIGIAATTAALCDIVYASDKAYFDTPFIRLGLCAEGASSYTFPNILGRSKASEALLLNKQLSAQEAYNFGLVSEVIPHENLNSFLKSLLKYGSLPVNIVKINKELIMKDLKKTLTDSNHREFSSLKVCTESEEFTQAVMSFLKRKSKL